MPQLLLLLSSVLDCGQVSCKIIWNSAINVSNDNIVGTLASQQNKLTLLMMDEVWISHHSFFPTAQDQALESPEDGVLLHFASSSKGVHHIANTRPIFMEKGSINPQSRQ